MATPEQPVAPQPASPVPRSSGLAVASLTLACVSMVLCICSPFVGLLPAVAAVICGHLGRSECQRDDMVQGGGMALAGLVLGYVCIGIAIVSGVGLLLMMILIFTKGAAGGG